LVNFCKEKTQNQAGENKKYEKKAFTEMNFIQKRRKIHPACKRWKSNLSNKHKYVPKGLGSFDFFNFKNGQNGQNRELLPIHGYFFSNRKYKVHNFWTESTHCMPNTRKKTRKYVGSARHDTLRGWWKSYFLQKVLIGFMTSQLRWHYH
jgi:hypothetical protein